MLRPTLEKHHIQLVIDFQGEKGGGVHDAQMDNETAVCKQLNIAHHRYPLAGNGTGDIAHYADALADMAHAQQNHQPVLIHCAAGTQRTGAATAFYRLLIEKKPATEAYAELTKYDWNPDKDAILIDYMNTHMRELAELLVAKGVIEKVPDPLPKIGP